MTNRSPNRKAIAVALAMVLSACGSSTPASYVASARTYLAKNDYPAAIIELKNALKADPNQADARLLLAKALIDGGNPRDAETEARKVIELNYLPEQALPLLLRTLLLQGEFRKLVAEPYDGNSVQPAARVEIDTLRSLAYLALGDREAARTALESALAADKDYAPAKMVQVRLAVAQNDLPAALEIVDAILAAVPSEIEANILKSDVQIALGRRDDGINTLQRATEFAPRSEAVRWALILALVPSGRIAEAESQLAEVKKLAPEHPRTWYSESLLAYAQGNMPAARVAVERAKFSLPEYVPVLYLSGLVEMRLGSYAVAEGALRAVVAKLPNDEAARRALATTFMRRGKGSQALETLAPLLRSSPNDPSLLRAVAEIHFALGNPGKAAEYFAKASKLDARNVAGRIRLAQAKLAIGEASQAIIDLEALAAAEPELTEPDLALISAHLQRRDFDRALAAVAVLDKKQPSSAVPYNIKGVVYMYRGDEKRARAAFERAMFIEPDYAAAAFNLARLDLVGRNYDGARAHYQRILSKDPQSEPALLALAELLAATKAPPGEVRTMIERAIAANPLSVSPRLALIMYNARLRDWPAAVAAAQKAQTALPDSPQVLEALGTVQSASGQTNQGIESFKRAVQMQPSSAIPLIRLAELQTKVREFGGAIESLRTAVDLQPDLPGAWVALSTVYADAGRVESGLDHARRLQKQRADRAVGFALEGELLARQKRWEEGAAAYRAALARQPAPFLVGRVHSLLESAGKVADADAVAQRWIKDHPTDVAIRSYLAEQSMNKKDFRAAAGYLAKALEYEPDNIVLLNNLGWTLNELGDPKSEDYAARAHAQAPANASAADTYGWILVQRGDAVRGTELLRQAVDFDPDDTAKRMRLVRALLKISNKDAAKKELELLSKMESAPAVRAEAQQLLESLHD
jgi:putative PEP-CTERM system TPR-repeat lipoprotein